MNTMLPTLNAGAVSLADVVPSCLVALGWRTGASKIQLPQSDTVVLILVDGLGAANIESASGYARFLARKNARSKAISTVFPSTTASALSSLVTGVDPGQHGIFGYRIWNAKRGEQVNQLSGVSLEDLASGWMAQESLLDVESSLGRDVFVVGHPRFAESTLTKMLYGSAKYCSSRSLSDRLEYVERAITGGQKGLFLVYISDLDETAHAHGVTSDEWFAKAEELDSSVRKFVAAVGAACTTVLTADHGVIDVPTSRHIEFGLGLEMAGVASIGGEPRCLQLQLDGTVEVDAVADNWRSSLGDGAEVHLRADVFARAYRDGLSEITRSIEDRAGEIYVFAAPGCALYDAREPSNPGRNMVGQHGGVEDAELSIPLLVWPESD